MRKRIVGLIGGRRRRALLFATVASVAALGAVLVATALAVHDTGRFQLDGDASSATQPGSPPAPAASDDWDKVCHQVNPLACPTGSNTTGATAVSWTAEPNLNSTIFTGGGSKDPQDVSNWLWKDGAGGLPDKDNLLHSFAARYSLPPDPVGPNAGDTACPAPAGSTTCELLVFGSDRYDNSGDAQQGFWFFQNKIQANGAASGGGNKFTGVHKNGDLLVISDFSNGGTTSTITVYQWNSAVSGNLELLATSDDANCASSTPGDKFCGIVNPSTKTSPWSFTDKSGSNSFLNGEFYEGGINLSQLGLGGECFASVASETRSSTSTTATLKDFVLANFGDCTSKTETTPVDNAGDPIPAGGLNIPTDPNPASIQVKDKANITVAGVSSFNATVSFHLCGPTATDSTALCSTGGVDVGSVASTANGTVTSPAATVTSAGRYCWRADFSGDAAKGVPSSSDSRATECFIVNPVTPPLSTLAGADVDFGQPVTDTATLTGTAHKPGTGGPTGSNGSINPTTLGGDATGTITFTLYKDTPANPCTVKATGTGTNPQTVNVTGDGTYGPVSFTPDAPGKYIWVASYGGDPPNTNASSPSSCSDANEDVVVSQIPTNIKTKQSWFPNDTATVSASAGNLGANGSVVFSLYDNATCDGAAKYTETKSITGGATSQEVSTSNGPGATGAFEITTGYADAADSSTGRYSWKVVYTPAAGDTAHTGKQSTCDAEHFNIAYTNDNGPGSPLP
jgi:hypothetical protein